MGEYAWDYDYITSRQEYFKDLLDKIDDLSMIEKYEELYDMYSHLILDVLFSQGINGSSSMSNEEMLQIVRSEPEANQYADEVLKIHKSIVDKMKCLDINLPNVKFRHSFRNLNFIKPLGEAIHDIFGDDAYRDFRDLAIDSKSKIQIGNSEARACLHCVDDISCGLEFYVLLPNISNMGIVSNLAHEAGHHRRYVVNNAKILNNHLLLEYESFSYEIRILDYFIKNGIYKKEAIKVMIRLINLIDALAQLSKELDIIDSYSVQELTRKAHERGLYSRLHIPNNESLMNYLLTVKSDYIFPYIYSALCVFEHMQSDDSMERYNQVIHDIGKVPEMELVKKIVDNPEDINNISGYKKYREDIVKLYKGV